MDPRRDPSDRARPLWRRLGVCLIGRRGPCRSPSAW